MGGSDDIRKIEQCSEIAGWQKVSGDPTISDDVTLGQALLPRNFHFPFIIEHSSRARNEKSNNKQ